MILNVRVVDAPLREPALAAHGTTSMRELAVIELHDPATGLRGYGEAAPLESYDGVSMRETVRAIADCGDTLRAAGPQDAIDPAARVALLAECERLAVLPQAVAAIDLALWDMVGRTFRQPLWRVLDPHGFPAEPVPVNWLIADADRAGAAASAARARELGYGTIKVKVALGDDAGRVAAVRAAAGPSIKLRLDANGAWSVEEAVRWLEVLEPAGIELCEEPVHGVEAIAEVARRTRVPVAIDESATDPGAFTQRRCRAICLKLSRCGGISGVLAAARKAREHHYQVYLASTYDGPLGIAAALHLAAATAPGATCGLATLGLFDRADPLPAVAGAIAPPTHPGLGAEALLSWYG